MVVVVVCMVVGGLFSVGVVVCFVVGCFLFGCVVVGVLWVLGCGCFLLCGGFGCGFYRV